jgi:hypothetical protein
MDKDGVHVEGDGICIDGGRACVVGVSIGTNNDVISMQTGSYGPQ